MQFSRRARKVDSEERILPLINVVFLLLIFFMLAGRLAASDLFRVDPPESAAADEASTADAQREPEVLILLAADGRLALDGAPVERQALTSAVAARLAEAPRARVVLKADGAAEAGAVVDLMESLRDAGVSDLELFAQSPQTAGRS